VSAPRLEVDLDAVTHNTRTLVDRLAPRGIRVTGVTKAALGAPDLAAAMLAGGASGLGDSRIANLARLRAADTGQVPPAVPLTLLRAPAPQEAVDVVGLATTSLVTEERTLDALSMAAIARRARHDVVLMVELGDLREGVAAAALVDLARSVGRHAGLRLAGIGTNLACQSGVVPGPRAMGELSDLAAQVETACGHPLTVVSGGNSASLGWALSTDDVGRVDDLRLGESLLLGTDPLTRTPVDGLRTDAFTLVAGVIEVQVKPAQPWGEIGQAAYGVPPARPGRGMVRQALVAVGRQDVDPDGISAPDGVVVLGASSDHLVLDVGDLAVAVGDELRFGLGYGALVRAATSPFVAWVPVPSRAQTGAPATHWHSP